mgnify:CR=1 FL=1
MITILLLVLGLVVSCLVAICLTVFWSSVMSSRVSRNHKPLNWIHQNFHKVNRDCGDHYHGSAHLPEMTIVERDHEI